MSEIEKVYPAGLATNIKKPIADPGIEPHRVRMTDKSEKAAKGAEQQIAVMFGVSIVGAIIAIWGFISNPSVIRQEVALLHDFLPPEAFKLLSDQVEALLSVNTGNLGVTTLLSTALALWSARAGVAAAITEPRLGAISITYSLPVW